MRELDNSSREELVAEIGRLEKNRRYHADIAIKRRVEIGRLEGELREAKRFFEFLRFALCDNDELALPLETLESDELVAWTGVLVEVAWQLGIYDQTGKCQPLIDAITTHGGKDDG